MKKVLQIILTITIVLLNAQNTANRFFYELTYKPHKDSANLEKDMMVLDIDQNKSLYQSYTNIQMDSIADVIIKEASRTGFPDFRRMGNRRTQLRIRLQKATRSVRYCTRIAFPWIIIPTAKIQT